MTSGRALICGLALTPGTDHPRSRQAAAIRDSAILGTGPTTTIPDSTPIRVTPTPATRTRDMRRLDTPMSGTRALRTAIPGTPIRARQGLGMPTLSSLTRVSRRTRAHGRAKLARMAVRGTGLEPEAPRPGGRSQDPRGRLRTGA